MSLEHVGKGIDETYTGNAHPFMLDKIIKKNGVAIMLNPFEPDEHSNGQHYHRAPYTPSAEQVTLFHRRVLSSTAIHGDRVLLAAVPITSSGVYLNGLPAARYLWREREVVPFAVVHTTMTPPQHGISRMVLPEQMPILTERALTQGYAGVMCCAQLDLRQDEQFPSAISGLFHQAQCALDCGLIPIIHIVFLHTDDRNVTAFYRQLESALDNLGDSEVLLALPMQDDPALLDCFLHHPNVIRLIGTAPFIPPYSGLSLLTQHPFVLGGLTSAILNGLHHDHSPVLFDLKLKENLSAVQRSSRFVGIGYGE